MMMQNLTKKREQFQTTLINEGEGVAQNSTIIKISVKGI